MSKIPCEYIVWNVLPAIRKEIAINLIENHGFRHREVADVLGITEASLLRYISGKRGYKVIFDKIFLKEIQRSTDRIVEGNDSTLLFEICRICNLLKYHL